MVGGVGSGDDCAGMLELTLLDVFQRLGMAVGIGFLVGIERGWRHRDAPEGSRAAGLRTHAVAGLLGGVSALSLPIIGEIGFAALALAFSAAFIVFKVRESQKDNDLSVTGTLAGLLVFVLGAYSMQGDLGVAAAAGVALVMLLAFKHALHEWLDKLTWPELRSALFILGATAIALPLLPDRAIDPAGAINPRELWLLTILVAAASFAGYVAVRVLGPHTGLLAGAAAGALVSSTVVTAALGGRVRRGEAEAGLAGSAAVLAAAVSISRVVLFVAAAATPMLVIVGPPLAAAIVTFLLVAALLARVRSSDQTQQGETRMESPLDIHSVLRFALVLGVVLIAARLAADWLGQGGLLAFAATAGLGDVDAVTLAVGSLVRDGLQGSVGGAAVLLAVVMNTLAKGVIAFLTGGPRYAAFYGAAALAALLAGGAAWVLAAHVR